MRKRAADDEKQNSDRWLTTYSDMMNNLLVLFIMLYAMSVMDLAKFEALAQYLNSTLTKTVIEEAENISIIQVEENSESSENSANDTETTPDEFDRIYETLKKKISEYGYDNLILLERGDNFIKFRFGDNMLFYPDKSVIKNESHKIMTAIGDILLSVDALTQSIEIGGHTATTGEYTSSFFSWELSSERAIAVLKYLVQNCKLPESKMSVSGFSRYQPVASNETEQSRQLNRRVEIKITRITKMSS